MERKIQKINCPRSVKMSPAKGHWNSSPVMFTNMQVACLTWCSPEAAKKGCAWANEAWSYFFPCRGMSGWICGSKGKSQSIRLKSFHKQMSAHPTEKIPSPTGTFSNVMELTLMVPNEAWQNLSFWIAKDICVYVCVCIILPLNGMGGVLQPRLSHIELHNKKLPATIALWVLGEKKEI